MLLIYYSRGLNSPPKIQKKRPHVWRNGTEQFHVDSRNLSKQMKMRACQKVEVGSRNLSKQMKVRACRKVEVESSEQETKHPCTPCSAGHKPSPVYHLTSGACNTTESYTIYCISRRTPHIFRPTGSSPSWLEPQPYKGTSAQNSRKRTSPQTCRTPQSSSPSRW